MIAQRLCSAIRRHLALAASAMTVAAVLGTALIAASPAQASAYGCTRWGALKVPGVGVVVPLGVYCFGVNGSGTQVNYTDGNYYFLGGSLHPALYNEREVVRFYDNSNNNYATFWEPTHLGWRYGNQSWTTNIHGNAEPGRVCGSLVTNGAVMATACEGIS